MSFLLAVSLVGVAFPPAPAVKIHAGPKECFISYMEANDKKDFAAMVACLSDDAVAVRNGYLLFLTADSIRQKSDRGGELQKLLERHKVADRPLDHWITAKDDATNAFQKSSRNREDWKQYDEAFRKLSSPLRDQRSFAVHVQMLLHKQRPVTATGFKITGQQTVGPYASLTVELEWGGNQIVWAIPCVRDQDGWKMMALPLASGNARPFPPK